MKGTIIYYALAVGQAFFNQSLIINYSHIIIIFNYLYNKLYS